MAAAIKALNAKIRSNKWTDYFCSTRTFLSGLCMMVCARNVEDEDSTIVKGAEHLGERQEDILAMVQCD
jgi:hypothetical protein